MWAATEGNFHFNLTHIAPPGTRTLIFEQPENRTTVGHSTKKSWYIGPCLNHYRTFKAIVSSTGAEHMLDTVKMKQYTIAIPTLTPADRILKAIGQLDSTIK
jgi:hypothetical protein